MKVLETVLEMTVLGMVVLGMKVLETVLGTTVLGTRKLISDVLKVIGLIIDAFFKMVYWEEERLASSWILLKTFTR